MAMDAGEIERLIKEALPDAQVTIEDLRGDGDHYAAPVVSTRVRRQDAGAAAPDRLRRAAGPNGHRAARARADHRRAPAPNSSFERTSQMTDNPVFTRIRQEITENAGGAVHEGHADVPAVRLLRRRGAGADQHGREVQGHRRAVPIRGCARASSSSPTGRRSRSSTSAASSSAAATSSARCTIGRAAATASKRRASPTPAEPSPTAT